MHSRGHKVQKLAQWLHVEELYNPTQWVQLLFATFWRDCLFRRVCRSKLVEAEWRCYGLRNNNRRLRRLRRFLQPQIVKVILGLVSKCKPWYVSRFLQCASHLGNPGGQEVKLCTVLWSYEIHIRMGAGCAPQPPQGFNKDSEKPDTKGPFYFVLRPMWGNIFLTLRCQLEQKVV